MSANAVGAEPVRRMFRVTYGWLGQPHRDRYKLFSSLADAQVFESRWLGGGRERTARLRRVAP